jgi:hypothetical protein
VQVDGGVKVVVSGGTFGIVGSDVLVARPASVTPSMIMVAKIVEERRKCEYGGRKTSAPAKLQEAC